MFLSVSEFHNLTLIEIYYFGGNRDIRPYWSACELNDIWGIGFKSRDLRTKINYLVKSTHINVNRRTSACIYKVKRNAYSSSDEPVRGFVMFKYICHSFYETHPCSFRIDHFLGGCRALSGFLDSVSGGTEGKGHIDDAYPSNYYATAGDYDHVEGPLGHIPLGLKVLLAAPFLAIGLGVGYTALAIKDDARWLDPLRLFVFLLGGLVGGIALVLPFY